MIFSAFGPRTFLNLSVKDLSRSELSFLKMLDSPPFPQRNYFSFISCFAKPDWAKFGDTDLFLWKNYLPAPKHIPRLRFDEFTPNAVCYSLEDCFIWSLANWVLTLKRLQPRCAGHPITQINIDDASISTDNEPCTQNWINNQPSFRIPCTRGFKIAALNIASLYKHIDQLRTYMSTNFVDILAINESRLDYTSNGEINIPGYVIER